MSARTGLLEPQPRAAQVEPDVRRPANPGRRPGWPAQPPKSPVRPTSPVRPPGPGRSGGQAGTGAARRGRGPATGVGQVSPVRRTSFVLLLLGLLGGGLVCLLVVNTTLAANSIEIINLQKQNTARSEQVQQLQQQVAAARSDAVIEREARRLGLRPDPELVFINLRTKEIEAPRGAAAAALAARLAAGWPASRPSTTGRRSRTRSRPGQ